MAEERSAYVAMVFERDGVYTKVLGQLPPREAFRGEAHKGKVGTSPKDARIRVFFKSAEAP